MDDTLLPIPKDARKRPVTQKDVARLAGVTSMAVSVALNGTRGKAGVSAATRERIVAAAQQLGYQPNAVARSFRSHHTGAIGIYGTTVFHTASVWAAQVLYGLQRGCATHHLDLLMHARFAADHAGRSDIHYRELANGKIDGLVLYSRPEEALLDQLRESRLALVSLGIDLSGVASVVDDGIGGMREIARLVHDRGHRRVLYRDFLGEPSTRFQAFQDESWRLGLQVRRVAFAYAPLEGFSAEEDTLLDLRRADRCTVLVTSSDSMAAPALRECLRRGWRVPEDLAVTGYDGADLHDSLPPRWLLTTVQVDWPGLAHQAVEVLARILHEEPVARLTVMPVTLRLGTTL